MANCQRCGVKVTMFNRGMDKDWCNDCSIKRMGEVRSELKLDQDDKENDVGKITSMTDGSEEAKEIEDFSRFKARPEGISKYVSPDGRSGRLEYFIIQIFYMFAVQAFNAIYELFQANQLLGSLAFLIYIYAVVLGIMVTIRRLHDLDTTGKLFFLGLIPLIGLVFFFILLLVRGTKGDNKYGKDPRNKALKNQPTSNSISAMNVIINPQIESPNIDTKINDNVKIIEEERLINHLERLVSLKNAGALTEEEFELRKKALL